MTTRDFMQQSNEEKFLYLFEAVANGSDTTEKAVENESDPEQNEEANQSRAVVAEERVHVSLKMSDWENIVSVLSVAGYWGYAKDIERELWRKRTSPIRTEQSDSSPSQEAHQWHP
jgi:hypothetical protein